MKTVYYLQFEEFVECHSLILLHMTDSALPEELHASRNKDVNAAQVQPRWRSITIYSEHVHKQPSRYLNVNASGD